MNKPHVQVELAILWADKTWGEHFEYVLADQPDLAIKAAAVSQAEERLKDNALVCMVAVYSVDGSGQRYDAAGEPFEEEKKYHVELTAQASMSCSVDVEAVSIDVAKDKAVDIARAGNVTWGYDGVDDESIECTATEIK